MAIFRLPPLLVNQIAAGEVIERPASVVKELVENAIDAGASRIGVAVEQGGKERITISDDGCGISSDDLPLALAPHATSKIRAAADLDAIGTMGFRGEALASIVSVSRLSIRSRAAAAEHGGRIDAEGDQVSAVQPHGGAVGTTVDVRNLFFNTPARRKFLKTDQTETTRVRETVQTLAMSHPAIGFDLRIDGRIALELPPGQKPAARVLEVLGRELETELLELVAEDRGIGLWGMIGQPSVARSTARHMHVYINGRRINDKSINHAIKEAYRGLIDPTRHPMVVLFMHIDPAQVDVNVHPAKAEVRFRQQGLVHGVVLSAVRQCLRNSDLTPELALRDADNADAAGTGGAWRFGAAHDGREFGAGPTGSHAEHSDAAQRMEPRQAAASFVDYFSRLNPTQKGFVYSEVKQALERDRAQYPALDGADAEADHDASTRDWPAAQPAGHDTLTGGFRMAASGVLQLQSTFVVTQDAQGLLIIDQHALHERVMFEKLKQRITADGQLESQRLLMPATVEVDQSQMEAFEQAAATGMFARLGMEIEPMGPRTLAVHAFTTLLFERKVEPQVFLSDLLMRMVDENIEPDDEAALHEVLDMMACKAAIKAGDALSETELTDLLRFREEVERASNCPHGRPTTLRLSMRELERRFGRR